jgi:hypothetical protein
MRVGDSFDARRLYGQVRAGELFDGKLGMYKLNAPLEKEGLEIGRSRVFAPGWLENASIWLHMEYKYLLELLKNGLYEEFYRDMKTALVPFQDASRYGRSTCENCSFLTPSDFFDETLRGNGFVARLSGATAEFLNMLLVMNLGKRPFAHEKDSIVFRPSPVLEGGFFTRKPSTISFNFRDGRREVKLDAFSYAFSLFEHTLVVYRNPLGKSTFGPDAVRPGAFILGYPGSAENRVEGDSVGEPHSIALREGRIDMMTIELGRI